MVLLYKLTDDANETRSSEMCARFIAVAMQFQKIHGTFFAASFLIELGIDKNVIEMLLSVD